MKMRVENEEQRSLSWFKNYPEIHNTIHLLKMQMHSNLEVLYCTVLYLV
jgi:hypothetical protein